MPHPPQNRQPAQQSIQQFDLLVVGAGMVGSVVACGMADTGLNIGVIDATAPEPYIAGAVPHIRVSALSAASEQILRNLGAWAFIEKMRVCPYRRMAVSEQNEGRSSFLPMPGWLRAAETVFDATDIGKPWLGHIIENNLVQLGLHQAMATRSNIHLFCPHKIVELRREGSLSVLTLANGARLSAPLLIGADGAQSQVRDFSGIGQYREQYAQQAMVCTVRYRGQQEDITWQGFNPSGPRAFLPLSDSGGQHYASLVWYDLPQRLDQLMQMDDRQLLDEIRQHFPKRLPPLEALEARGRFPLYKSHANRYAAEGVVLVGDAAHTINPLAGQGANLGFMDAAVLVDVLSQAYLEDQPLGALSVLQQYERKRRLANQAMMNVMDVFYHSFSNDLAPLRIARNLGLGLANQVGLAKKQVMRYAMGIQPMGLKGIGFNSELPRLARTN